MKIILNKVSNEEEEKIVINYHNITSQIKHMISILEINSEKILGINNNNQKKYFCIDEVLYFESMEGILYAYLQKEVYKVKEKLEEIISVYEDCGITRCSRVMVVNITHIKFLKSLPAGKILATLDNEENIIISRKYARILREKLKNGR